MCDFKPGDEVVCVDAVASKFTQGGYAPPLVEGRTYQVSDVFEVRRCFSGDLSGLIGVALVGHEWSVNSVRGAWAPSRFRKLQRRDLTSWLATENTIEGPVRSPAKVRAS